MAEAEQIRWVEVSLTLTNELAEAVSEVLSRYVQTGVVVESDMIYNDAEDRGTPSGKAKVYGYLPFDEFLDEKKQKIEESLWYLSRIMPLPDVEYRQIHDEDWMSSWKQHYHPVQIGERLIILPAWVEKYDPDRIPVRIDPSMAFGTGTHPTTQLSMLMLEKYIQNGQSFMDIGCGSGILSIAAAKLGAEPILGVDVDLTAVRSSHENAALNEVQDNIHFQQGSVTEILNGQMPFDRADIVLANILTPIILKLLGDGLTKLRKPEGTLILSGILEEQKEKVVDAVGAYGLHLIDEHAIEDWIVLVFQA